MGIELSRRDFSRVLAGGALAALPALGCAGAPARPQDRPAGGGIKISLQFRELVTDDDLVFARQLGVEYVSISTRIGTAETFAEFKKRAEAAGLRIANIGNMSVHNMQEVTLNLPGRDEKIAEYKQYLRNLAKAGICYTT